MKAISINYVWSINCSGSDIKGIAFNGKHFVLLRTKECEVIDCYECFRPIKNISLQRNYISICYDNIDNCYWAITCFDTLVLYQLDMNFHEIAQIKVCDMHEQQANGISCSGDGIWISFTNQLAFFDKKGKNITFIKNDTKDRVNTGIIVVGEYRIVSFLENCQPFLDILHLYSKARVERSIPQEYNLLGMVSCHRESTVGTKGLRLLLLTCESCELVLADCCNIFKHFTKEPPCSKPTCSKPTCCEKVDCLDYCEVMYSIALEEAAIAHILNAEGEKIQKAVAEFESIEQLLCVNESVIQTMTKATILEGQLLAKLEILFSKCNSKSRPDCICNCCDKCCDKCCDECCKSCCRSNSRTSNQCQCH